MKLEQGEAVEVLLMSGEWLKAVVLQNHGEEHIVVQFPNRAIAPANRKHVRKVDEEREWREALRKAQEARARAAGWQGEE